VNLPPLVASVPRVREGAPRGSSSPAGVVASLPTDTVDNLERDTFAAYPDHTQDHYDKHVIRLYRMGQGCDHSQNNFWAWCYQTNSYRCCPRGTAGSYRVGAGCGDCNPI
jgi:hypothetical protein